MIVQEVMNQVCMHILRDTFNMTPTCNTSLRMESSLLHIVGLYGMQTAQLEDVHPNHSAPH